MSQNKFRDVDKYVFLGGGSLKGKTSKDVLRQLKKCSFVKPKEVLKNQKVAAYCLVEFFTKQDASSFYYYYRISKFTICKYLEPLNARPAHFKDKLMSDYDFLNLLSVPDDKCTWCTCGVEFDDYDFYDEKIDSKNKEIKGLEEKLKKHIEDEQFIIETKKKEVELLIQLRDLKKR